MAEVLGLTAEALRRGERRAKQRPPPSTKRRGRPPAIPPHARSQLRQCYRDHHGQWGPTVLACWAVRQGFGRFSPSTIGRVIADKFQDLAATGWGVTRAEIDREVGRWFGGAFEEFCAT